MSHRSSKFVIAALFLLVACRPNKMKELVKSGEISEEIEKVVGNLN